MPPEGVGNVRIYEKIDFLAGRVEPSSTGVLAKSPVLAKMAVFTILAENARIQGKTMGVLANISLKTVKIPRHSGAFLTPFGQTSDARFWVPFSVRAESPLIQGSRKVEITKHIIYRPIHQPTRNWWPGLSFCVRKSRVRADVSPRGENDDFS